MSERSIIVKGNTLENALSRAMALLSVSRSEITYEVLQEGSWGRSGLVGTPFKLRVTVGGAPVPAPLEAASPGATGSGEISLLDLLPVTKDPGMDDLETLSPREFLAFL